MQIIMQSVQLFQQRDIMLLICLQLNRRSFLALLSTCKDLSTYRTNVEFLSAFHRLANRKKEDEVRKQFSLLRFTLSEVHIAPRCANVLREVKVRILESGVVTYHLSNMHECGEELQLDELMCHNCIKANKLVMPKEDVDLQGKLLFRIMPFAIVLLKNTSLIMISDSTGENYVPLGNMIQESNRDSSFIIYSLTKRQRIELAYYGIHHTNLCEFEESIDRLIEANLGRDTPRSYHQTGFGCGEYIFD